MLWRLKESNQVQATDTQVLPGTSKDHTEWNALRLKKHAVFTNGSRVHKVPAQRPINLPAS